MEIATKEHHCWAVYFFEKKRWELTPTNGRLAWPNTRTVPASKRPSAMTNKNLLRHKHPEMGNCCKTAAGSTQRRTRKHHSGCNDSRTGRSEMEGAAAIVRPTMRESEVCTRTKLPKMKRSPGGFRAVAHVTSKGLVASSKIKQRTKSVIDCDGDVGTTANGRESREADWTRPSFGSSEPVDAAA
mmetsp:Transcript_18229/g.47439  ORF Transcript_18229/g.47439 Transcript_18229/m.47439 type:complete len:185 (-) Transcript_18229:686-1240(-)